MLVEELEQLEDEQVGQERRETEMLTPCSLNLLSRALVPEEGLNYLILTFNPQAIRGANQSTTNHANFCRSHFFDPSIGM